MHFSCHLFSFLQSRDSLKSRQHIRYQNVPSLISNYGGLPNFCLRLRSPPLALMLVHALLQIISASLFVPGPRANPAADWETFVEIERRSSAALVPVSVALGSPSVRSAAFSRERIRHVPSDKRVKGSAGSDLWQFFCFLLLFQERLVETE